MGQATSRLRAVVTGASSGIGEHIARELAKRGCALVLAARRGDRLEALARELGQAHDIPITAVAVDLGSAKGRAELEQASYAEGGEVDILINNAGFGDFTVFTEREWEAHDRMLQLNVVGLAELSHRFGRRMVARGQGGRIVNIASVVGFMPVPYFANYCATKAYVRSFSEALAAEMAPLGITVTCVSPGATRSEFTVVAGMKVSRMADKVMMTSERVAQQAVAAAFAGRRSIVTGVTNKLFCFLARVLPRRTLAWGSRLTLGRPANLRSLPARGES